MRDGPVGMDPVEDDDVGGVVGDDLGEDVAEAQVPGAVGAGAGVIWRCTVAAE